MSVRWRDIMQRPDPPIAKSLSEILSSKESLEQEAQAFADYCHKMDQYYDSIKEEKISNDPGLIYNSNQLAKLFEVCYKNICERENVCYLWK